MPEQMPQPVLPEGIDELGDSALLVTLGRELAVTVAASVWRFEDLLRNERIDGIVNLIPAPSSLLVAFDSELVDASDLAGRLDEIRSQLPPDETWESPTTWRIPARYGGQGGPDLEEVAEQVGVSVDALIEEHTGAKHVVFANGFAPGFCYLGLMPEHWDIPRRVDVKSSVPTGSISVAVRQTVLSATPGPTGWSTIARTPFINLDAGGDRPVKIVAGDAIRFEPVTDDEFVRLAGGLAQ